MRELLDELDTAIVAELQKDSRRTNSDIARTIGCSEGTVRRRVDRLIQSKVCSFVLGLNPLKLGYRVEVMFMLKTDPGKIEAVANKLAKSDETSYIGLVTGQFDLLILAHFPSNEEVFEFIRHRIIPTEGIRDIQTLHVLNVAKRAGRWIPVEDQAEREAPTRQLSNA